MILSGRFLFGAGSFMLYKSYTRTEQFTHVFRKLEFYETLELVPRFRHVFERKTRFFAIYIVNLVDACTYVLYLVIIMGHIVAFKLLPSPTMLVSTVIWTIPSLIMIRCMAAIMLTCFFYVYIITLYLNLRFRQINDNIIYFSNQSKC